MPLHRPFCAVIRTSLLALGSIAIVNCSSNVENETIQQVTICSYNQTYRCDRPTRNFISPPSIVMLNANIADVPYGTTVTVEWSYQGKKVEATEIAAATFQKADPDTTSMYATLTQPDNSWPTGTYEVALSTDGDDGKVTKPFSILNSSSNSNPEQDRVAEATSDSLTPARLLQDVVLCQLDALDTEGNCVSEISIVPKSSPGLRIEAAIPTAPVGTTVVINWRYINEGAGRSEDIQTDTRSKENNTVNQIDVRLTKPADGWKSGIYEVILTVPSSNTEIERKQFIVQ